MGRYDLTDAQWERLEPHLPPKKPRTGRPNHSYRRMINGMPWIARSSASWLDLLEHYGAFGTVASWFHRWRRAGIWQRILEALQARADRQGRVDWSLRFVDSTSVRAHQHAVGARKAGKPAAGEALGRSRGGFSTKIHIRAEGLSKRVTFTVTGGEVNDTRPCPWGGVNMLAVRYNIRNRLQLPCS